MVLALKQAHESMKYNRELSNKPTQIWSVNLEQRSQEYKMGKGQSLNQWLLGKQDSHMQKMETRLLSNTTHTN